MTKTRAVRLLLVAALAPPFLWCIPSLPPERGSGDGGSACATGATGAVGVVGCPCATPGALACNGNDSKEEIVCSQESLWQGNGGCASDERCATTGPNTGTCVKVEGVCADASPDAKVCGTITQCPDGGVADAAAASEAGACSSTEGVFVCGPDLITSQVAESCGVFECKAGKCTESCAPGTSTCGGVTVNVCGPVGTFTDITCPGECVSNRCLVEWSNDTEAIAMVLDDAYVFWVDGVSEVTSGKPPAAVWRAALTSSAAVSLYTAPASGGFLSVALDSSNVYFAEEDPSDGGARYGILQMARAGGVPVTLATPGSAPVGLGSDGQNVYWAESPGMVMQAPTGTPGSSSVAAMGEQIEALAVDPTSSTLYWIDTGPAMNAIVQASPGAGMNVTLATTENPQSLAVYEGTVYWTTSDENGSSSSGAVYSWSAGVVSTLAAGMELPYDNPGIAANGAAVAWITREEVVTMPVGRPGTLRKVSAVRPTAIALGNTFLVWSDSSEWASRDLGIFGEAPP